MSLSWSMKDQGDQLRKLCLNVPGIDAFVHFTSLLIIFSFNVSGVEMLLIQWMQWCNMFEQLMLHS